MADIKYSIQWNDPEGMGFWIRGINPDGSFHGELMYCYGDPKRKCGTTVEGKITSKDWNKCKIILEELSSNKHAELEKWTGQVASWTDSLSHPKIIFRYISDRKNDSSYGSMFLELKSIIENNISEQCKSLKRYSSDKHTTIGLTERSTVR